MSLPHAPGGPWPGVGGCPRLHGTDEGRRRPEQQPDSQPLHESQQHCIASCAAVRACTASRQFCGVQRVACTDLTSGLMLLGPVGAAGAGVATVTGGSCTTHSIANTLVSNALQTLRHCQPGACTSVDQRGTLWIFGAYPHTFKRPVQLQAMQGKGPAAQSTLTRLQAGAIQSRDQQRVCAHRRWHTYAGGHHVFCKLASRTCTVFLAMADWLPNIPSVTTGTRDAACRTPAAGHLYYPGIRVRVRCTILNSACYYSLRGPA